MGTPRKLAKRADKKEVRVGTHVPVLEICFKRANIRRVLEHGMGKVSTGFFHGIRGLELVLSLEDDPAWKKCDHCDLSVPSHTVASYTSKSDMELLMGTAFDPAETLVFLDGPHKQRGEIFELATSMRFSNIVEHDTESLSDSEMRQRCKIAGDAGYESLTYTQLNPETTLYTLSGISHEHLIPVHKIRSLSGC